MMSGMRVSFTHWSFNARTSCETLTWLRMNSHLAHFLTLRQRQEFTNTKRDSCPKTEAKNTSIGERLHEFVLENARQCLGLTMKIYIGFARALRLFTI
jgi:hypothetical protein